MTSFSFQRLGLLGTVASRCALGMFLHSKTQPSDETASIIPFDPYLSSSWDGDGSFSPRRSTASVLPIPKQGFVIAVPRAERSPTGVRLRLARDGTTPNVHHGVKRGATVRHSPITPFQTESPDCGRTAAPCPSLYAHRQACPGLTQAVLYVLLLVQATPKWSRLEDSAKPPASPFSTQTPNWWIPHSFFQPSCCLIPFPRLGVTEGRLELRGGSHVALDFHGVDSIVAA